MEDQDIITLFQQRNEQAIHQAAARFGLYCRSIAARILQNPDETEEILDDTWLTAWQTIPPEQPKHLRIYLGRITRNLAIDRWRKQHAIRRGAGEIPASLDELSEIMPAGDTPEDALNTQQLTDCVNRFLYGLPERERTVFVLRYWHLESISNIAQRFGYSEARITSMLFRIRKKLRKKLTEEQMI